MMRTVEATGTIHCTIVDDAGVIVAHQGGDLIPFSQNFIDMVYDGEALYVDVIDSFSFKISDAIFYYAGEDFLTKSVVYRIFQPEIDPEWV